LPEQPRVQTIRSQRHDFAYIKKERKKWSKRRKHTWRL